MREWLDARAFCERYAQPVRQEAVDRMLRLARSERGKVSREAVREACAGRPPLDLTRILQGR